MGLLKQVQRRRKEQNRDVGGKDAGHLRKALKIICMSATLEASRFSNFFGGARVVYVSGTPTTEICACVYMKERLCEGVQGIGEAGEVHMS